MSTEVTAPAPTRPDLSDGDHDGHAHYVRKADIVRANVEGVPAVALCGKRWIPNRNPDGLPVCPTCKKIKARLSRHNN